LVDWSALLGLMSAAAGQGKDPFAQAVRVQERLFTTKPIALGIEECVKHPVTPCGLNTDAERARHVRKRFREMLNSQGEWEPTPPAQERPWREVLAVTTPPANAGEAPQFHPAARERAAMEKVGLGELRIVDEEARAFGRATTVADLLHDNRVLLAKWVRRLVNWNGRQMEMPVWENEVVPLLRKRLAEQRTPVIRFTQEEQRILAIVSIADLTARVPVDKYGIAIWRPIERDVLPPDCARCELAPVCQALPTTTGVALLWRRLGLIDAAGAPTRRGQVVSFFSQGDGLAIAAALEEEKYPLDEVIYDLADLDASFRFCGEDHRWSGRLAQVCQQKYGTQSIPGYLENGVPPKYGAGAEQVVASVHRDPSTKHGWVNEILGAGDIDRVIIEWRSTLRQIAHAPELDWPRWTDLQKRAREILNETESPTLTELPSLEFHQTRRVDHRLILRRH
jgi:hypothetical protein